MFSFLRIKDSRCAEEARKKIYALVIGQNHGMTNKSNYSEKNLRCRKACVCCFLSSQRKTRKKVTQRSVCLSGE